MKGIELMNEPRVSGTGLTMGELKGFYQAGTNAVRGVDGNMGVAMHGEQVAPECW